MLMILGYPAPLLFGQLLLGLINGAFYALLSLGLAVIFGMLNIVNFAHGALFMLGAFVAWGLLEYLGIGYWPALILAPIIVGAFGLLLEKVLISRLYKLDHLYGLLLTFGLALIIEGIARNEFGSSGMPYRIPDALQGATDLGFMFLPNYRGWVVIAAAVMCLALFSRPLVLPDYDVNGVFSLHIVGTMVCLGLDAVLLVVFVTRMSRNLRDRDAHLAALRQHAAEESHIVRMGLLATGAAHELGTPLASLAVILGDWRRMPAVTADDDMTQELEEMQTAVGRCKAIVTSILLSAGETRGEASGVTTVEGFIADIVAEWRRLRATAALRVENRVEQEMPIVFDSVLRQSIFNVLDNALEVSPDWVRLLVERRGETLVLRVSDAGPGFDPAILAQIGKPYQSSKGRPGGGLGLFLVFNVVRKLGGAVAARNMPGGGAEVTLELPLDVLAVGDPA